MPLRPQDVTPLDIFLCGHIRNAVAAVTHSMLQNTWTEVEYRLGCRRASSSAHIEI
jgi:hypothetical protein